MKTELEKWTLYALKREFVAGSADKSGLRPDLLGSRESAVLAAVARFLSPARKPWRCKIGLHGDFYDLPVARGYVWSYNPGTGVTDLSSDRKFCKHCGIVLIRGYSEIFWRKASGNEKEVKYGASFPGN